MELPCEFGRESEEQPLAAVPNGDFSSCLTKMEQKATKWNIL